MARNSTPLYLGRRFAQGGNLNLVFNTETAGYIMNRKALEHFVANAENRPCSHKVRTRLSDVLVARCLRRSNPPVHAYDTRDSKGRERFHPFAAEDHVWLEKMPGKKPSWYETYTIDVKYGWDCCSPASITFHGLEVGMMYDFDKAIYMKC